TPYLAKIPSCWPISSGIKVQAVPTDLPTRSLSAAFPGGAAKIRAQSVAEHKRRRTIFAPNESSPPPHDPANCSSQLAPPGSIAKSDRTGRASPFKGEGVFFFPPPLRGRAREGGKPDFVTASRARIWW